MQRIGPFCALRGVMTIQQQPFADFMRERELALRRFATVLTGDPRTSEEIVVDVLSRAWEKWDHIGDLEQPNAYVRKMIVNEFLAWGRRVRRTAPSANITALIDGAGDDSGDHARSHSERATMIDALARLPRKQRAALVLRFYEGWPDADIAAAMGCSQATVRSNASRALSALRIQLHGVDHEPATRAPYLLTLEEI
jgi:RNA polymerase sigma-70 factor (sigma-E family)